MSWFSTAIPPLSRGSNRATGVILVVTAAVMAGFCAMLWPEWRQNPDLSHGFFAPVVCILLLVESRRVGPLRWWRAGLAPTLLQITGLAAAVALFALAGLFAASVGWSHALVLFLLAASFVALLGAAWLVLSDERVRFVPCNWVAATGLFLWLLVAPLPTGLYYRLTLFLQNWVSGGVMAVLNFFGVPARQHGNVIELAHATVGVAEACSGIRSLLACMYAGFFFAAWLVRQPLRRLALIVLAPFLALGMNFVRSLTLTLLADRGVEIGGAWHDVTGYAVLGSTALILAVLALRLESPAPAEPQPSSAGTAKVPFPALVRFVGSTGLIVILGAFFLMHSHRVPETETAPPALAELLPANAHGWHVTTPDDLYQFAGVLQTTHLIQRTYIRPGDDGRPTDLTVYIAYWPAGQTSVSRVASHTPDACWPGSGWFPQSDVSRHGLQPTLAGVPLPGAEYRLFRGERNLSQHVWFWHIFDGRAIGYEDPYSLRALLETAWKYGFGRQGSQYFVRISSTRPWHELEQEPLFREVAANLRRIGL